MNDYAVMERNLVKSMVETMEKQEVELSDENISYFIKKSLTSIVFDGRYNHFTSRNNARQRVMNFFPNDYANLVIDRVNDFLDKGNSDEIKRIKQEKVDSRKILKYIEVYSKKIFPKVVSKEIFDTTIADENYMNILTNLIDNKKFHKPSNECREAILSGKQTKVSFSSAKISGMVAYSDEGKVRKNQEDSYYIGVHPANNDFKIMLVADGMGGHSKGEVASNIATKEMVLFFEGLSSNEFYNDDNKNLENKIINKMLDIDEKVKKATNRGGTTLCFAIIKNNNILVGNIGDSRCLIMEDGKFKYSTVSQNLPHVLKIPEPFDRFHPKSNVIFNALGNFDLDCDKKGLIDFDVINLDSKKEYDITVCSDGVSDCLSNDQIIDVVNSNEPQNVAKALVNKALNTDSTFRDEYNRQYKKVKAGIISVSNWKRINEALENGGLNLETAKAMMGGKDNTTAVATRFSKRR